MEIRNIDQARSLIDEWREKSPEVQGILIRKNVESMELGQLYHESKENEAGVARLGECIDLLRKRLGELEI